MRWLIIDEASTVSPGLLGTLDAFLKAACDRHPFAKDGRRKRPFGGLNIVFAGDLWQLPPVRASAIFSNPFKRRDNSAEQVALCMFGGMGSGPFGKVPYFVPPRGQEGKGNGDRVLLFLKFDKASCIPTGILFALQ